MPRIRTRFVLLLATVALLVAACDGGGGSVTVGSADFDENEIVASMYAEALEDAGYDVTRQFLIGSREAYFPALENAEIDLIPEYVGTLVEFLDTGATGDVDETTGVLADLLPEGLTVLEPADAENANGLVVTGETADENGLEVTSDLEAVAGEFVLGGPPECPERPLCLEGFQDVYGLEFAEFQPLDAGGPVTVEALGQGEIDVAVLFTTDQSIVENDWVLLDDDQDLQPAENIAPVVRDDVVDEDLETLLNDISAALTTDDLTELNRRVRSEGEDPADVAVDWLTDQGLLD